MKHISEALNNWFDRIDAVVEPTNAGATNERAWKTGDLATGFADLDHLTGGFRRSDLIVVAGSTSVGKTSLALGMTYGAAIGHGETVGYFTLETSARTLANRIVSMETGIEASSLRSGQIKDHEWDRLSRSFGRLNEAPIYFVDTATSISDIEAKAHRLHKARGLDLIVGDYLQLVAVGHGLDRTQEIAEITRRLKALARELDVPVVALSQLSRAVDRRASHVPVLTDLRDGGSIEADADIVLFIHREDRYEPDTERRGLAEIIVAKHRNGPVGSVNLRFFDRTARFADLELFPGPGM